MRPGHGSPRSRAAVAFVVVSATAWGAAPARANARLETEEQRISRILQSTLVAHGAEGGVAIQLSGKLSP